MVMIQCKEHQLWSADPIKAMKAFYDCQTRQVFSQKKNFENNCIDDRHWATDLIDVREAFYEYAGQVKISNTIFALFKKQMHKSLYADFEKSIKRLKKRLQHFICDTQLNQLLESNSCRSSCYTNDKEAYGSGKSFEEFSESLLNDQCNVIYALVNCLKIYIDDDVIFKLLDVKSLEQDESSNCLQYIYTYIKKIVVSIVLSSCKGTVEDKPIDCCSQDNYNSGGDSTVNKGNNRPICQSQTADCSSGGCLTVNKCETRQIYKSYTADYNAGVDRHEIQPICEMEVRERNCCEDNLKLKYELAEMEMIKKQLICEKRLKEVAGYKLLFAIRKASLNIKRENKLSYYL